MSATRQAFEMERERAKAGGYKTLWLLEDLQFLQTDAINELETLLNAHVEPAEIYRLVGRAILKLQKAKETVLFFVIHCSFSVFDPDIIIRDCFTNVNSKTDQFRELAQTDDDMRIAHAKASPVDNWRL